MWPASIHRGSLQWSGQHCAPAQALPCRSCCSRYGPVEKRTPSGRLSCASGHQQADLPGTPRQQQQHQLSQNDPRLKWARPEWIRQPQQQSTKPARLQQTLSSSTSADVSATVYKKRQRLLQKVTYGSYSSRDNDDDSELGKLQSHQLLYQALAVDFGAQRIGIAVRRSGHNVPLLTLHRQQYYLQQKHSSSSSSCSSSNIGSGSASAGDSSMVPLKRTAAAILHLALQQGCDGFVVGLPLYSEQADTPSGLSATAAAVNGRWINNVINTFAEALAELAAPLQLPVLLVNEQQSSQQARAVMSAAAAYDIKTAAEIESADQPTARLVQHRPGLQQQSSRQERQQRSKQQQAVGRDAYAAALILSRYYNGLVTPLQHLLPGVHSTAEGSSSSSGDANDSNGGGGSSSRSTWAWSSKRVQQQAATDFKYMLVPPAEQRRRQAQREQIRPAAAEATAAAAAVSSCSEG